MLCRLHTINNEIVFSTLLQLQWHSSVSSSCSCAGVDSMLMGKEVSVELQKWLVFYIMAYSSTSYAGMAPKEMAATLKAQNWHAWNVCVRLVEGLHEPYQPDLSHTSRCVNKSSPEIARYCIRMPTARAATLHMHKLSFTLKSRAETLMFIISAVYARPLPETISTTVVIELCTACRQPAVEQNKE